MVGLKNAIRF